MAVRIAAAWKRRARSPILLLALLAPVLNADEAKSAPGLPATDFPATVSDEPDFDSRELEGGDAKVAALQAHRLLQSIASKQANDSPSRASRLNYLLEKLNPVQVIRSEADIVTASRLVDAMATWTTSSGPPFPRAADVLLPLIGIGPPGFREAVIGAVKAIVKHEIASGRRGAPGAQPTLDVLAARFAEGPLPSEPFARDAARILWETDGKKLLEVLVTTITRHAEAGPRAAPAGAPPGTPTTPTTLPAGTPTTLPAGTAVPAPPAATPPVPGASTTQPGLALATVCLEELRSRTALDFPTVDGWKKWWNECRALSLERILEDAQRRSREVYASNWRQLVRRLRETGDSERILLAIQDTIENVYTSELRIAAVLALGDFAEWALEGRGGEAKSDAKLQEDDPRARLLAKAVQILMSVFQPRDFYVERPEVLRGALASLRKYNLFLERNPELLAEVSRIVIARFQALFLGEREAGNEDLLETIRLAGALRVAGAVGFIEGLLRESRSSGEDDLAIVTAAVTSLGRIADKGISPETASLILDQLKQPRAGAEKSVREFRRACVAALTAGSESPAVRAELLAFFKETLLGSADKDLRIPAILGLGTLARQKEAGALAALEEVLARQDDFEPREVIAAIDSIAYVGGEAALGSFVKPLPRSTDKEVEEHLLRKTAGIIEEGGVEALAWMFEKLETAGLGEDSTRPAAFAVAVAGEPQVKPLLLADKLDLGDGAKAEAWWRSVLALARASDLVGSDEELDAMVAGLSERVLRAPALKEKVPRSAVDLAGIKATLERRAEVRANLSRADSIDPAMLVRDLAALTTAPPAVLDRWRNLRWILRQLSSAVPRDAAAGLAALWRRALESEELRPAWVGFPPGFRERHLSRLDALKSPAAEGAGAAAEKPR
jgi:hypothetical protein